MTNISSSQQLFQKQNQFLNKNKSLSNLFDKFQIKPCFEVPERQITVNVDNITLSPDQYTIFVNETQGSNMRIIYYCILYYIFERNPENKGLAMYQKMLNFIYSNDMEVQTKRGSITDQESKIYFTKFFYSLFRSKCKRKIIVEEMAFLPQMDILMRHLIKKITGENDLILEINGPEIINGVLKHLGFQLEFLNTETFLFQGDYVVEIRHYNENSSFHIRHEKLENISKLRKDILMAESAHFSNEKNELKEHNEDRFGGLIKFKVTKKSTIKSIGLVSEDCEDLEERNKPESFMAFGGLLNSSEIQFKLPQQDEKDEDEDKQESFLEEFDMLINASSRGVEERKKAENPESTSNLGLPLPACPALKNSSIHIDDEEVNQLLNESKQIRESFVNQFEKLIYTQKGQEEPIFLENASQFLGNFSKEKQAKQEKQEEEKQNVAKQQKKEQIESIVNCSETKSIKSTMLPKDTNDSWLVSTSNNNFNNSSRRNPFSNPIIANQSSPFGFRTLVESQSTKLIKSGRFEFNRSKVTQEKRDSIRIPTFIRERAKAKEQNLNNSSVNVMKSTNLSSNASFNAPKIIFTYQKA